MLSLGKTTLKSFVNHTGLCDELLKNMMTWKSIVIYNDVILNLHNLEIFVDVIQLK